MSDPSDFLSKLLPTFEENEDEDVNVDDIEDDLLDGPTSPPDRPSILANLVESSPVIEQRPSILAGFATPEKPEPAVKQERPPPTTPAAPTSASTVVRTPSQPKITSAPLPRGLPDELKRCLALSVQTLLLAPSSLTKNNITNEIKGYCSAIGTEGPILKFSELFGPIAAPDVYIPRKKQKIVHKNDGLVYETDDVANFKIPMTVPEEVEVHEDVVHVSQDVKNMATPLGEKVEIGKLEENTFKPLEQDNWEDRVAWDAATESAASQPTPEQIPSFPRKETLFIPSTNIKKPKTKKLIEPEPLWSKPSKKGLWGEVSSSSSSTPTMPTKSHDDIFDEVLESSSSSDPMFRSLPLEQSTKTNTNGSTSTSTANGTAMFKCINTELLQGDWRKSILWDDTPPERPFPNQLLLDLNDPAVFPEDISKPQARTEVKLATRKRKDADQDDIDKFNLSNDRYYRPNASASKKRSSLRKAMVHHSEPALKLTYVKPHLTEEDLGNFHRPRSWFSSRERYLMGPYRKEKQPKTAKKPVPTSQPVVVHQRNENVMKTKEDLSGKEGRVVLMEYIEENPLVVSNFGMGTKIKNYYRKKNATENPLLKFEDGENVLLDHQDESPFLGDIEPGKSVQALDNNLFRAPIVKHTPAETDFLLIKSGTSRNMVIREIPALYVVGQIQPKMEIYAPNSRAANAYIKNRLQGYIYRLFMKKSVNHRLKISDIMTLFPGNSETSIRKRLKDCADFQRGGDDSGWWTVKDQSQLPSEEELRAMVTPEMCCLWESMLAGQYRLQQANVRRHANISPALQQAVQQIESEADDTVARAARWVEDELQITPWNLSSNFVATIQGKGLLQLTGFGDPSGQRGEAFSYLRLPQKAPSGPKKKDNNAPKSQVTGTDADLRKLSLENSRLVLLKFGVPDSEIQKLGRWERIALVRKKSSEAAVSGEGGNTKFARGTRYSVQEQQHQYKEQVQLIWDNQMKALTENVEEFSDDEAQEEDLLDDLESFGKDLESSLEHKKNLRIAREREEEEEREEMERLRNLTEDKKDEDSSVPKKVVRRTVTITHPDGTQERKTEVIRDPKLIEEMIKRDEERKRQRILQGGNPKKARPALTPEELEEKERTRKERRRLQEQLRRLKKNKEKQDELKEKMMLMQGQGLDEDDPNAIKCGACGLVGHMRTNRSCPMFDPNQVIEETKPAITVNTDLVRVEGGKIKYPKMAIAQQPELKLRLKFKDLPPGTEKRLREEQESLNRPRRRRRTIPKAQILFCNKLDEVWKDMIAYEVSLPFAEPVSTKIAPDYYDVIKHPMDLKTIRNKIKTFEYRTREEFLADVKQMVSNCHLYNGDQHLLSQHADNILQTAKNSVEKKKELEELEKAQNEPEKNSDDEDELEDDEDDVEPPPEEPYDDDEDIEIIE